MRVCVVGPADDKDALEWEAILNIIEDFEES